MNDFEIVVNKIVKNSEISQNGHFNESNNAQLSLISKRSLYNIFSEISTVYKKEELGGLKEYKISELVLRFLGYFNHNSAYIGGDIYILSIDKLIIENSELAPGAFLIKYGFLAIAKTTGGNSICIDLNNPNTDDPRVLIADKSVFCDRVIYSFEKGRMIKEELSLETINKYATIICERFSEFLRMLSKNEISDFEVYLQ
ncbi:MAG: hypothetical protein JXR64_14065 [Spirochaetales bacterium]|nr:hypothetical protein [Spirochaetales bacterium]